MSKFDQIIHDATDDDDLRTLLALNANRFMNMVGGRPSDAARAEVRDLERYGADEYRRRFDAVRANSYHGPNS